MATSAATSSGASAATNSSNTPIQLRIKPRTFYYIKFQNRILQVEVDIPDAAWAATHGLRALSICRTALIRDLGTILEKEKGAMVVPKVLMFEYALRPCARRDHLLVGEGRDRCEVFPYFLHVTLHPPDHPL